MNAVADAGYDGCSTASNHSYDHGAQGVVDTINALDSVHVGHAGNGQHRQLPVHPNCTPCAASR